MNLNKICWPNRAVRRTLNPIQDFLFRNYDNVNFKAESRRTNLNIWCSNKAVQCTFYSCDEHFNLNEILDWKINPKLKLIPTYRLKRVDA